MEQQGKIQRDVFQIKGDVPDPSGQTGMRGQMSGVDLTSSAAGHPLIYDRVMQRMLTIDVYRMPGTPTWLHLLCPRCEGAIKITEETKGIEYQEHRTPVELLKLFDPMKLLRELYPHRKPDLRLFGGTLSVEPFRCTYDFDGSVCGWHVAIERNLARRP